MIRCFIFLILLFVSFNTIGQTITPAGTINICVGESQKLTFQGLGENDTIQWQKDNVDILSANKPDYTATLSGDYRVKLPGEQFTNTVRVVVNPYPIANFNSSFVTNQCSNEPITFTNTSTSAATYVWDFGDPKSGIANNTSTLKDPTHTFIGNPGNLTQSFTIKLKATSAAGGCFAERSISITPRQIPDGAMGGTGAGNFRDNKYFKICGNVPSGEFTFSNQTTTKNTNVDYRINWGDGSPDFFGKDFETLTNTYSIGTHKIVLTINGTNGCKSTTDYYAFVGTNPAVGLANPGNTATCSGEALTFPITETANNVPGTIYTLTFNDGSPPKEYIHPAVPTVEKHTFEVTSCGTNSSDGNRTYTNSFSASIQASNPCASSSASIVPIYVTEKPKANFTISPKDTVCVNTKVTFTNTSKRNIVDNGICKDGNSIWKITPSSGWTILKGSLGNDYNSTIPSVWQSGSNQLELTFSQPGVYSIRLKTGSDFCGINEIVQTICVNLPPTGDFSLDKNIGCGPLTVSATTTSSTPTCGKMRYRWAVKYESLPGCAPGEGKFDFVSGTNLSSQNPVIQFTDPGIYSVGLTIINPGNACSTVVASKKITVKSKPVIQVNGIVPEICQNNFVSPKLITACSNESPPTYLWTFDGGVPATSTDADPGKIFYNTPGKFSVRLIVTNDCGTDTYSSLITVNPAPVLTLPADIALCNGSFSGAINFTSIPAGTDISWTNNNPGIGLGYSGTSGIIPSFTAINNTQAPVKALINVLAKLGSCSDKGFMEISVHPRPQIPAVSNIKYCQNETGIPLKATTTTGNTLLWYSSASGGVGVVDAPIPNTSLVGVTNYYVSQVSVLSKCESGRAVITVNINPIPKITSHTWNGPDKCGAITGKIVLKGLAAGTIYEVSYTKDGITKTENLTSDITGQIIMDKLSAGRYENIYVTNNGCKSNELDPVELNDPNPPQKPSAGRDTSLCVGTTLGLTATSLEAGVIYNWRGPNGFLNNTASPSISNIQVGNAGSYFVKVIKDNCASEEEEIIVTVNQLPPTPSILPVSYCIDAPSVPLFVTGNTIQWYAELTGGIGSNIAPVPSTIEAGTKAYYVTQTDINKCESVRGALIVTVHPNAKADFTPVTPISCPPFAIGAGDIDLKKYPGNNQEYLWYADNVLIGSGDFPGYRIEDADKSVVIKLKTISSFGCKADSVSHTFSTFKVPKPSFTLSVNNGCGPLTVRVENNTPGITYYKYVWNFGNGQTSDKEHPEDVVFMPNPKSGDTTYYVSLRIFTDCDVMEKILPVYVKSKPIALFTPSKTEGCSPMKVNFKNTTKGLNTTYHWDFGDGKTYATNIAEDVEHTFYAGTSTNYTVRLTATNECGVDYSEFIIVVAPNQINLNFAMNGPDHFGCQPHTVNFFNNSSGASAYFWDFGDGNFKSTTLGVETVTHTYLIPGKYEVKLVATSNCSDTATTDYVTIYPKPKAAFTADHYTSCKGDEVTFGNQSELATSYLWSFGDGSTSTLAEPGHLYTVPGIYTVRLTVYKLNGPGSTCTDFMEKQIQVVETLPGIFTLSDSKADCAPLTVTFENENLPSVTALWDLGDGTTASGDRVMHTYKFSGTYTVTLKTTSPGGCNYTSTKTVEINGPSGTLQYAGGFACSPTPVRLEAIATNTNTYQWDFGDGVIRSTFDGVLYYEYINPGTYLPSVTLLNNTGCRYPVKGVDSIKIDRIDAGFISVLDRKCGSTNVIFTDTSHVFFGIKSVQWDLGDGAIRVGKTVNYTYTTSGKYWIEMIITGNSGCTQTVRKLIDVHVNNTPTAAIIADASKCTNQNVLFRSVIQSEDALNTIKWTISNGVTGTGENFNYTFVRPGIYTVNLAVSTVNNCYASTSHTIEIKPSPVVKASGDVTICLGNSIQLNASGAVQYQWTPLQNLSCTTCPNPIATPNISTPYIIEGLNSIGCPGYDTVNVTVIQPLKMTSSGNDSICIGQTANLMVGGAASYKWTPGQTLSSSTVANPVATPAITTGYRVVGYDGHNCFTDTAFIIVAVGKYPTVDLGPDKILPTGTILPLVSTFTEGPMKDWKWTPTTDLDCIGCAVPNAHIKKDITYAVEVTSIYGCKASDTISIKVFCENTQVFIPNAFSPDGDGINDVLMVRGKGISTVKSFRIFNRWGQLVFERNNFPPNEPAYGWDGKVGGKPAPPEVYVYTAEVLCENGIPFTYKGNTTIIK